MNKIPKILYAASLLCLTAALPTVDNSPTGVRDEYAASKALSCNLDNCLRAYVVFSHIHIATSFCATYIPPGTLTTIATTISSTTSYEDFLISSDSPTQTDYFTYTELYTIGADIPLLPTTINTAPITTTTFPPFMSACDYDAKRMSSACSCVLSSVTTVLKTVYAQEYVQLPYTETTPPFPFPPRTAA